MEDKLIEMQLTDLTQKSAGKAIIDHPTTSDRDHILISLDPCSASRNSSTPGSQYQACFGFSDDCTPVLSCILGHLHLGEATEVVPYQVGSLTRIRTIDVCGGRLTLSYSFRKLLLETELNGELHRNLAVR
ncbi:hypothetical protein NXS19_003103 [Fusarium pseudograminearum]|nr:hypothetical protein NXS19_003103 [Fusarium pseudograminearum]